MARIDKDKVTIQQPKRINYAIGELNKLGIEVRNVTMTSLQFTHKGQTVTLFPYSGWHTGKTITDGRGIEKLLNQLKED